jgi:hypothetical protein
MELAKALDAIFIGPDYSARIGVLDTKIAVKEVPEPAVFFRGAMARLAQARGLGELFVYNRHDDPDI